MEIGHILRRYLAKHAHQAMQLDFENIYTNKYEGRPNICLKTTLNKDLKKNIQRQIEINIATISGCHNSTNRMETKTMVETLSQKKKRKATKAVKSVDFTSAWLSIRKVNNMKSHRLWERKSHENDSTLILTWNRKAAIWRPYGEKNICTTLTFSSKDQVRLKNTPCQKDLIFMLFLCIESRGWEWGWWFFLLWFVI